jgi:hypothetical protein
MRTKLVSVDGVLPLLILFFSVSSTAMAQLTGLPQYGVILAGTPDDPVILNQSPHRILVYALRLQKGDQDRYPATRVKDYLRQLTTPQTAPSGAGIAPGATSLSLPQVIAPQTKNAAGQRTDIGYTQATLDSVLFDNGQFVGPDVSHTFESTTARITGELSVHSLLLSAKTAAEVAAAWDKIKEIAETPVVPSTSAPGVPGAGRPGFGDPSYWPRQSAIQLLAVRDHMGEATAYALAASTQAYPKIQREPQQ